jgi:sulfinoalanine decarboxylase
MDHLMDMAQYCKDKVQNTEQLELMADVNSLTVCFRYNDEQEPDLNKFNLQVREYLRKSGMSMVNYGYIDDDIVIRFVVANADVQQSDIDTFIQNFEKAAKHIKKSTNLDEKGFNHRFGMAPNAG